MKHGFKEEKRLGQLLKNYKQSGKLINKKDVKVEKHKLMESHSPFCGCI
jgi:hypothetical protein